MCNMLKVYYYWDLLLNKFKEASMIPNTKLIAVPKLPYDILTSFLLNKKYWFFYIIFWEKISLSV